MPSVNSAPKKYIRVAEVTSTYGIKPGVVYNLIKDGKIRSLRAGGKSTSTSGTRLIDVASLEVYLNSRATGGAL